MVVGAVRLRAQGQRYGVFFFTFYPIFYMSTNNFKDDLSEFEDVQKQDVKRSGLFYFFFFGGLLATVFWLLNGGGEDGAWWVLGIIALILVINVVANWVTRTK